mmetsp:Transcript_23091/g.32533  ORF Transcript_23091/g.32533 Transcript_23091/m.32533 type:complete len:220 (+) Transcript_23091:54-713(+)
MIKPKYPLTTVCNGIRMQYHLLTTIILMTMLSSSLSFTVSSAVGMKRSIKIRQQQQQQQQHSISYYSFLPLGSVDPKNSNDSIDARMISAEEAANMGIRDWPQQTKSMKQWSENVDCGKSLVRYVLQGSGKIVIEVPQEDAEATTTITTASTSTLSEVQMAPGLLINVNGPASLDWIRANDNGEDIIILTPGFEEGGALAIVAFGFLALCVALIAGVGS